jgi:hypothetical protein
MRRWRKVKAKPGQLVMQYGRDDDGEVDVVFAWGEGCSKRDGALLHWRIGSDNLNHKMEVDQSLLKELDARGYDLTTIRFSISKKVAA